MRNQGRFTRWRHDLRRPRLRGAHGERVTTRRYGHPSLSKDAAQPWKNGGAGTGGLCCGAHRRCRGHVELMTRINIRRHGHPSLPEVLLGARAPFPQRGGLDAMHRLNPELALHDALAGVPCRHCVGLFKGLRPPAAGPLLRSRLLGLDALLAACLVSFVVDGCVA